MVYFHIPKMLLAAFMLYFEEYFYIQNYKSEKCAKQY